MPVSRRSVRRAVEWAAVRPVTYDPSREGPGRRFADDRVEGVVGHGEDGFAAARDGLRRWRAHRAAGLRVLPAGAHVTEGATCVVAIGTGLLSFGAPCRISEVRDEDRAFSLVYRTVSGHPEDGEERFMANLDDDGTVRFVVSARSRPASALARAAGPLARRVQHVVARRYVRSLARYVAGATARAR